MAEKVISKTAHKPQEYTGIHENPALCGEVNVKK